MENNFNESAINEGDADSLEHYGRPHSGYTPHSGRYPWGSGENAGQRHGDFRTRVKELEKGGLTKAQIAEQFGFKTVSELKAAISADSAAEQKARQLAVYRIYDSGITSPTAIGKKLGLNESTIRGYLDKRGKSQFNVNDNTKDALIRCLEKDKYIDVGKGIGDYMGITDSKLKTVTDIMKQEGYSVLNVEYKQANSGNYTPMRVLCPPGTTKGELMKHLEDIKPPFEYTVNSGTGFEKREPIQNIDSKRVFIRYSEDGGVDRDGTIELRRGVPDLSLGKNNYAQVRIGVDDKYYLKGMAVYRDDIPDGYDIVFNTNKKEGTPMYKVFKPQDGVDDHGERVRPPADPSNPFGSSIKDADKLLSAETKYTGADGKQHLSAINFVKEEDDVSNWRKTLPTQFLGKQTPQLAKKQLDLDARKREEDYEEIMKLTNAAVKESFLRSFADECDTASVELRGAALPRQSSKILLPSTTIKDNEVYAPGYDHGEEVVLVRYPHEGTFQMPRLRVNNNDPDGKKIIGQSNGAIAISKKTADQMSGADFDGDTAIIIPTKGQKIKTSAPVQELIDFDNKVYKVQDFDTNIRVDKNGQEWYYGYGKKQKVYRNKQGFPTLASNQSCGNEMGIASNLIMDMTNQNAPMSDLVRAVKYSMTTIDAYKHGLNYKQAYDELAIKALKDKYQPKPGRSYGGGAASFFTKVKSQENVEKRKTYYNIDPETGEAVYAKEMDPRKNTQVKPGKIDKETGKVLEWKTEAKTTKSKKGLEYDPYELLSTNPTEIELVYADHARRMKTLANKARLSALEANAAKPAKVNKEAAETYKTEVASLKAQLALAEKNAPLERQAQLLCKKYVDGRKYDNPDLKNDYDAVKKITSKAIVDARARVGAKKTQITISDKEWEAIQAGAIPKTTLDNIIKNTDETKLKQLAMPRAERKISDTTKEQVKLMESRGYTISQIADKLGLSSETVGEIL